MFAKTHPGAPAEFFTTEATGLTWLRDAEAIAVRDQRIIALGTNAEIQKLITNLWLADPVIRHGPHFFAIFPLFLV